MLRGNVPRMATSVHLLVTWRKHMLSRISLAVPLAAMLIVTGASVAYSCTPHVFWYQPCGVFGTSECVCNCYGTTGGEGIPVNCREL